MKKIQINNPGFFHNLKVVQFPLHFQRDFHCNSIWIQLLNHTSIRLQIFKHTSKRFSMLKQKKQETF